MNEGTLNGFGVGRPNRGGRFAMTVVETTQTVSAPPWCRYVSFWACGAGGGGGGGRLGLTTNAAGGGGGGGGAAHYKRRIPMWVYAAYSAAQFQVTIGAGGTGGAGATVDATNGSNGTAGGSTTVRIAYISSGDGASFIQNVPGGGSAGGGGTTGPGGNATGGTGLDCVQGGSGGNSNVGTGNFPVAQSAAHSLYAPGGGHCGQAKNSASGPSRSAPMRVGSFGASGGGTLTLSTSGETSERMNRAIVTRALAEISEAPAIDELWWATITGGYGGTGGDTTTGSNGGNGGNGWRGSGGGGGGGAGVATFVGGTGAAGGNGCAIFFWEEW